MRAILAAVLAAACTGAARATERPIIGILSMPSSYSAYKGQSDFPASYVKFLEQAGARVVPIPYDLDAGALEALLQSLNGALFTGGAAPFFSPAPAHAPTAYALTAQRIYAEVQAAAAKGETWPLWGTCLGHECVALRARARAVRAPRLPRLPRPPPRARSTASLRAGSSAWSPPAWTMRRRRCRAALTAKISQWRWTGRRRRRRRACGARRRMCIGYNAHTQGFTPADFNGDAKLSAAFNVLGTSQDRAGKTFVASMEGKTLPIYTTQWHPEKAAYEWNGAELYNDINHSPLAVSSSYYPAAFFVNQARMNNRSFASADDENAALIYNYAPVFAPKTGLSTLFEQLYFFPASQRAAQPPSTRLRAGQH